MHVSIAQQRGMNTTNGTLLFSQCVVTPRQPVDIRMKLLEIDAIARTPNIIACCFSCIDCLA